MIEIVVAKGAGFCFGVKRAVQKAYDAAVECRDKNRKIYSLGPIIHNPQVVADLEDHGIIVLNGIDTLHEVENSSIVFRSHGVSDPELAKKLASTGVTVYDCTCPYVKKAQQNARTLLKEGYNLIIVGDSSHPEVKSILGHCNNQAVVSESVDDIKYLKNKKKIGIIAQTTQSRCKFIDIVSEVISWAADIKILNTICDATSVRQAEASRLAKTVDLMLVIGGRNSANTTRLAQVCRLINKHVHHIETAEEIKKEWFAGDICKVGITGGASTPAWMIDRIVDGVHALV